MNLVEPDPSLSIQRKDHPTLPLSIYDYHQYESPRFHPTVELCRGIIVDRDDNNRVVGKPFSRFYNVGENSLQPEFPCTAYEKMDGSLCIVYNYQNEWRANSRFSWGDFYFEGAPKTFSESVLSLLGDTNSMSEEYTYLFEYTSPYNQVVVPYKDERITLLGVFHTESGSEVTGAVDFLSPLFRTPQKFTFRDTEELRAFIEGYSQEGVVIQPTEGSPRLKLKTEQYLRLHKLKSGLSGSISCFLDLWVAGEVESTVFLLPQYKEKFAEYQTRLDGALINVYATWEALKHAPTQKEFALEAVKYPFSAILFSFRKGLKLDQVQNLARILEKIL